MTLIISAREFAFRRGFREMELYGWSQAYQRAWKFGDYTDQALRNSYRDGADRARNAVRRRSGER